jgi:NAD(P)-dependent dehydrogenase (short-subunit alcohol dehydrogenase family)
MSKLTVRAVNAHRVRMFHRDDDGEPFDADTTALEKMIPLGRTGTPDDIADMAVALFCDRFSRYVTGTTIAVDGGLSLYNWIPFRTLG